MEIIPLILLIMLTLGLLLIGILALRNIRVYNYRSQVLAHISELVKKDVANGKAWRWRYDVFTSVDYDKMLYQFWRPLKSFYTDQAFLQE